MSLQEDSPDALCKQGAIASASAQRTAYVTTVLAERAAAPGQYKRNIPVTDNLSPAKLMRTLNDDPADKVIDEAVSSATAMTTTSATGEEAAATTGDVDTAAADVDVDTTTANAAPDPTFGATGDDDAANGICRFIVVTGPGLGKTSFAHAVKANFQDASVVEGAESAAAMDTVFPPPGISKTLVVVTNTPPPAELPAVVREAGAVPYLVVIAQQDGVATDQYSTIGYESWCMLRRHGQCTTDRQQHEWAIAGGVRAPWMSSIAVHDMCG